MPCTAVSFMLLNLLGGENKACDCVFKEAHGFERPNTKRTIIGAL